MGSVIVAQVSTGSWLLALLIGLIVGAVGAYVALRMQAKARRATAEDEAERILGEAKSQAQAVVRAAEVESKATFLARQEEFDAQTSATRAQIREAEKRLDKREDQLERQLDMLRMKERSIEKTEQQAKDKLANANEREKEVDQLLTQQRNELLKVTQLSMDDAKQQLFTRLENELERECSDLVAKKISEAQDEAETRSREVVITAIQRYAAAHTADATVSTIDIPSDEMKGRVIGREGRNIRAFEKATGVNVVVDDTPGVIEVTATDPVRREVAKQSMNKLVHDGRIHPTRIEEVVAQVQESIDADITERGKKAAMEANVQGLSRKVTDLLGRLHYRTSYGQNVLRHSIEVAYLCQVMADELGLNSALARRCGLLHDIGKAMDHETEGGHPAIGADFCRKLNEKKEVLNAIAGHHGDEPSISPYTPLVAAADAISAARPGSRRESLERYIKRLQQLEELATNLKGVDQAYAIQAGREVRVIVDADGIDDNNAMRVAREIAKKIEDEMTYPGEVRVTVIREVRAVEYAR